MNIKRLPLVLLIAILFCSSCTFSLPFSKSSRKPSVKDNESWFSSHIISGQHLNDSLSIAFTPFKAGAKAEANEELDKVSLMIAKGFRDVIESSGKSINILEASDIDPDLVLSGYVQELTKPSRMSKLKLKPKVVKLIIDGEIWKTSNGERVLVFNAGRTLLIKEDILTVAYDFGRQIADDFIKHLSES